MVNNFHLLIRYVEKFPEGLQLRGGIYFVDSIPKTHNGKFKRNKIVKMAEEMFKAAIKSDRDIQRYLSDIPNEYKKLIYN